MITFRPGVSMAAFLAVLSIPRWAPAAEPAAAAARVPVIYGSDLFHPHDDPDDHYDLATLFALPEFDIKAILLDLGDRQKQRPGRIPLEQMFHMTGRSAPFATGLSSPLKSPDDKGLDRPADDQKAIELLIQTLREAPEPVTVIMAGSVRDLVAAFNREPALLREKIARAYINIGSADASEVEWNVRLDAHAYQGVMKSGLPIYWCPCVPGNGHRHSTYWKFRQDAVLENLPRPLLNFFVYALQRVAVEDIAPLAAIDGDLAPFRRLPELMERNMWCTAGFLHAAGYRVKVDGERFALTREPPGPPQQEVFRFVPVRVELDREGRALKVVDDPASSLQVFSAADNARYQQAMLDSLRHLLQHLSLRPAKP